jgi:hypothetical protein
MTIGQQYYNRKLSLKLLHFISLQCVDLHIFKLIKQVKHNPKAIFFDLIQFKMH